MNLSPNINSLQLQNGSLRRGKLDLTKRRLSDKIQSMYSTVDANIHREMKISTFKKRIEVWIKANIDTFSNNAED